MIRTHEELDAIINEGVEINNKRGTATMEEWQFNALIATARAAIPRPTSEAPKDGTKVFLMDGGEEWHVAWFHDGFWFEADDSDIILDPFEFIPLPEAM